VTVRITHKDKHVLSGACLTASQYCLRCCTNCHCCCCCCAFFAPTPQPHLPGVSSLNSTAATVTPAAADAAAAAVPALSLIQTQLLLSSHSYSAAAAPRTTHLNSWLLDSCSHTHAFSRSTTCSSSSSSRQAHPSQPWAYSQLAAGGPLPTISVLNDSTEAQLHTLVMYLRRTPWASSQPAA
jgi:hypothetical protein